MDEDSLLKRVTAQADGCQQESRPAACVIRLIV
jgi:hypothetical protein